ncbi:hypothetical protein FKM82_001203 [Ascaphus truei]
MSDWRASDLKAVMRLSKSIHLAPKHFTDGLKAGKD